MDSYVERVVDLTDPAHNRIGNMTVEEARRRVLSGRPEAVREVEGSFAPLARDGKTVRLWGRDHEGWLTMDATATLA